MEIGDSKLIEIVRKHIKINSKLLSKGREKSQIVYVFRAGPIILRRVVVGCHMENCCKCEAKLSKIVDNNYTNYL